MGTSPGILAHRKSEDEVRGVQSLPQQAITILRRWARIPRASYHPAARVVFEPEKKALVVSQLPSHLAVLIFSCLTWNNKNKVSQNCPFGCFFKKGYPQHPSTRVNDVFFVFWFWTDVDIFKGTNIYPTKRHHRGKSAGWDGICWF